jgi:hypothetical protein
MGAAAASYLTKSSENWAKHKEFQAMIFIVTGVVGVV